MNDMLPIISVKDGLVDTVTQFEERDGQKVELKYIVNWGNYRNVVTDAHSKEC